MLYRTIRPKKEPIMTTNVLPVAVAYFMVRVPANRGGVESEADAIRVIERYLYNGSVVTIDLDMDDFNHPAYVVAVRIESHRSLDDLTSRVEMQRDRLSSGLYSSTEPKILS